MTSSTAMMVQDPEPRQKIDAFMDNLMHGKLSQKGSCAVACQGLSILRLIVDDCSWTSAQDLMTLVKNEGRAMSTRCGQTSMSSIIGTVFENHRKSLIQHCERSELHLHFEWTKVN